jgi:site-specific recombinase XerD
MTRYSFVPAQTGLSGCLSGTLSQCRSHVSERGAPLTPNGFFKMLSRAADSIGMADVHPDLLRHDTGFRLVNDGVDTRTLAAYLGRRNMNNTARYTRMDAKRFAGFWQD